MVWLVALLLLSVVCVGLGLALQLRWTRMLARRLWLHDQRARKREVTAGEVRGLTEAFSSLAHDIRAEQAALHDLAAQNAETRAEYARLAERLAAEVRDEVRSAVKAVRAGGADDVAQTEAFLQLLRLADLREALPRTRGFPVSPDALLAIVDEIRLRRPALYLDLGSGTSTVVAASAARAAGIDMKVVAVDHEEHYADLTRLLAARHGLADRVEVRVAPLVPLASDPERRWYDPTVLDDLKGIGICFVDGPPGGTNVNARHPAMEFLDGRLDAGAVVLLDDTAREDESDLAERWASLPGVVSVRRPPAEKGLAVITYRP